MKKYRLLQDDTITVNGRTLYRIQALRNFSIVTKGDLGGYIETEDNLSHKRYCWVFNDAKVYDNARVYDNAWVFDDAQVYGNAKVYGNARILNNTHVYGNARISGVTRVYGNSTVRNVELSDGNYYNYQWYYETPLYKAMYKETE